MSQISDFFTDTLPSWWSPTGLIQVTPGGEWTFRWVYVGLIVACFLVALVSSFLKIRPSLKERIQALGYTNAFIGLLLYFCRDQKIPYLGMDLWRFVQEIGLIFWINSIVLFSRRNLKKEVLSEQVQARREKYLPKKTA